MAHDDLALATMIVEPRVSREKVVALIAGTTPAKLARVLALLRPAELVMAMTKMRAAALGLCLHTIEADQGGNER